MQNFTSGRKGINWFLFAFILFIGTLSSYGQCADVNDEDAVTDGNQQSYCYLSTIQDLLEQGTNDGDDSSAPANIEIYETASSTNPIDRDELLADDATYYFGDSTDSSCSRVAVEITINAADTPTNTVTNSEDGFTVTPCESSEFNGNDLLDLFDPAPAGYTTRIYNDQFDDSEISDYTADLEDGNSYFVGFSPDDPNTNCPSQRVAVGIDVVNAPAPTADSPQTFCEGATVGDLTATSNTANFQAFRWYRSATASTPLADDVELVDGEDYFVSQIVNERNSIFPPCESERTQVFVEVITFDAGPDVSGNICEDDLRQRINNGEGASILFSFITDGRTLPDDVSFDPSLQALAQQFTDDPTQPIITTATFTTPEGCTDDVMFNITVNESYNAGDDNTDGNNICRATFSDPATEDEVIAYLTTLLSDDADEGGDFSNITSITNDINNDLEGPFSSTYTVGDGTFCEDNADLEFSVTGDPIDLGEQFGNGIYCQSDVDDRIASGTAPQEIARQLFLEQLDPSLGIPTDGTFERDNLAVVVSQYDRGFRTFNTTYTVNSGGCTSSIRLKISIVEEAPANAGSFDSIENVCSDEELIDLTELMNNDPDATIGGRFSGDGVTDNVFDPSIGEGTYTITYLVDESTPCTTGSDSTTFDISVISSPLSTSVERNLCVTEARDLISSPGEGYVFVQGLLAEAGVDTVDPDNFSDGAFAEASRLSNFIDTPSSDSETFNFEYTNPSGGTCDDETIFISITIEDLQDANAGEIGNKNVCIGDSPIDLNSYLTGTDATRGGTFTGTGVDDNFFDPSIGTGTYTITYNVDDSADCTTPGTSDSTTFDITVTEDRDLGDDITVTFCETEIDDILTASQIRNYFASLIGPGYSSAGTFNPSIETIRDQYNTDNTQTFTTVYSIGDGDCADSVTIKAIVLDETAAEAGTIENQTVCSTSGMIDLNDFLDSSSTSGGTFTGTGVSDNMFDSSVGPNESGYEITYTVDGSADCTTDGTTDSTTFTIFVNDPEPANAGEIEDQTVCSNSGMIDLSSYLGEDASTGGVFSGTGVSDGMFDSSLGSNEEGYEITYNVDDSADCVLEGTSDSTTFTISIQDSFSIGENQSRDVCQAQVDELFPGSADVRAFYNSLLDPEVVGEGTFNPSIQSLIDRYNSGDEIGEFKTVYTVVRGSCSASVELTINVVDSIPAEIGDITDPDPICRNADDVDLFSYLPADANPNGTFEGYEDGVFSPGMEGAGTYEITYSLTEDSPCTEGEASATFTVTVLESAYAGQDMELSVCMDDDTQDLFTFLSVDADDNGEFTLDGDVIADGMMNPADFETGTYTVIYTVPEENDCGADTAEFEITVEEAPGAPTVDGDPFTFCATDDPTGADLSATGSNLTYYSDAELTMMVAAEDELVSGTYYVTQRNDEGACESEAAEFTVTVNDADTPTTTDANPSFCQFDDATIADLTESINESGTITWYDSEEGDNALNSGTSLQDGVTYYATLFNVDTGCESSVRLAVTVTIDDNCPIVIPEGFSPNGDGLNDTFDIENIEDEYPNYTIEIRNRFGDVVYKGNASTPDWDGYSTEGSFGSDLLPVGAYFYYLSYNDGSTEPVRGTVYLSR